MMIHTRNIIDRNQKQHSDLEYYKVLVLKVEENADDNPDISIESCKSLIEGLCKYMYHRLNPSKSESELNALDFHKLFKQTAKEISSKSPLEMEFIYQTSNLIQRLGELRNRRGDISHGKLSPKSEQSTKESARMIMGVTDHIVHYMLEVYLSIDMTFKDEVDYQDHLEFNEALDDQYPIEGLSYSQALLDQKPVEYKMLLADWELQKEEELEE